MWAHLSALATQTSHQFFDLEVLLQFISLNLHSVCLSLSTSSYAPVQIHFCCVAWVHLWYIWPPQMPVSILIQIHTCRSSLYKVNAQHVQIH